MRHDFETADRVLVTIPKDHRTRVAHFLEKQVRRLFTHTRTVRVAGSSVWFSLLQGFKQQALAVSQDPEHRFDLALQLGDLQTAYQLACEADVCVRHHVFYCTLALPMFMC